MLCIELYKLCYLITITIIFLLFSQKYLLGLGSELYELYFIYNKVHEVQANK